MVTEAIQEEVGGHGEWPAEASEAHDDGDWPAGPMAQALSVAGAQRPAARGSGSAGAAGRGAASSSSSVAAAQQRPRFVEVKPTAVPPAHMGAAAGAGSDSSLVNYDSVAMATMSLAPIPEAMLTATQQSGLGQMLAGAARPGGHAAGYGGGMQAPAALHADVGSSLPNMGSVIIPTYSKLASALAAAGVDDSTPNFGTVNLPAEAAALIAEAFRGPMATSMAAPEPSEDVARPPPRAARSSARAAASDVSSMDVGSLASSRAGGTAASSKASQHVRTNYVNPM